MVAPDINDYTKLSLPARLAVALHCFERYCRAKGLRHILIDTLIERMWELPCARYFPDWEKPLPELIHISFDIGEGRAFPTEIVDLLGSVGVAEREFGELLVCTVMIIYTSAYGKSDDPGSLEFLQRVFSVTSLAGVTPPPAEPFMQSLFAENYGWGVVLTAEQRDGWRFRAYDNFVA